MSVVTNLVIQVAMGLMAIVVFMITVIATVLYIIDKKKYDFRVKIYEFAGNNQLILKETEKAGIFVDRVTKYKRLWLKRAKVGLSPDNPPYILDEKGLKVISLVKDGTKSFRYLNIKILTDNKIVLSVTEEDVNWAITDYERVKAIFTNQFLQQVLPYIGLILMGIFILGIVAMVMKDFKEILPVLKDILSSLQQIKSGTTVI